MRMLAVGDIHGCSASLDHLLAFVEFQPDDLLITVGDYIDRGPDSKGVLERLIQLGLNGNVVSLRGNHEIMMLAAREGSNNALKMWLSCGGVEALESYVERDRTPSLNDIPEHHWHFLTHKCCDWYETDTHIFAHANLHPEMELAEQTSLFLHWEFLDPKFFKPHKSGKTLICGHSERRDGIPLVIPGAICIDTWAYGDGWLTCLDVNTGDYWQVNELGERRQNCLKMG